MVGKEGDTREEMEVGGMHKGGSEGGRHEGGRRRQGEAPVCGRRTISEHTRLEATHFSILVYKNKKN